MFNHTKFNRLKTKLQVRIFPAQEVLPALMETLFLFTVCANMGGRGGGGGGGYCGFTNCVNADVSDPHTSKHLNAPAASYGTPVRRKRANEGIEHLSTEHAI